MVVEDSNTVALRRILNRVYVKKLNIHSDIVLRVGLTSVIKILIKKYLKEIFVLKI